MLGAVALATIPARWSVVLHPVNIVERLFVLGGPAMIVGVFLYSHHQANQRLLASPHLLFQPPHRLRLHRIRRQCYQITCFHYIPHNAKAIMPNAEKTPIQLTMRVILSADSMSSLKLLLFILIVYHPFVISSSKEPVKCSIS